MTRLGSLPWNTKNWLSMPSMSGSPALPWLPPTPWPPPPPLPELRCN